MLFDVCLLAVTRARLPVPPLLLLSFDSATHPAVQLLIQEPPSKPLPCISPSIHSYMRLHRLTGPVCPLCHPAVHQPASQLSTALPAQLALGTHDMDTRNKRGTAPACRSSQSVDETGHQNRGSLSTSPSPLLSVTAPAPAPAVQAAYCSLKTPSWHPACDCT